MEVKTDNSKKVKLIASIVGVAVLVTIVLLLVHNNSAEKETSNGYLANVTFPSDEYTYDSISPNATLVFNADGRIDFSQVAAPTPDMFFGRLFGPVEDVDWALRSLFVYASDVVIAHIENVDRFVELDRLPIGNARRALALPQARVLYSFKGDLRADDIILVHEPIIISLPYFNPTLFRSDYYQARHYFHMKRHLLQQDMILVLFLLDSDVAVNKHGLDVGNMPIYLVPHWFPHNFFFNNQGNLANSYDNISFAEVVAMLNEISADHNHGALHYTTLQNDDILIFMNGTFYGAWTTEDRWRRRGNSFYDLFSANTFFVHRQGDTTPVMQPNMIYISLDFPNYPRRLLESYASHNLSTHRFGFDLPTATSFKMHFIELPNIHTWVAEEPLNQNFDWSDQERNLLMISSPHNPSPRQVTDIPITTDMVAIVRDLLDARGLIDTVANITYAISVDLHGNGQEQTIIVANNLSRKGSYIFSQAEMDAQTLGIYSFILLVQKDEIQMLTETYFLRPFTGTAEDFWIQRDDDGWSLEFCDAASIARRPFFFDVNGDGVFEIFASIEFWEGHRSPLIAYKDGTWSTVLWTEW